jgi:dTDP-4-amino-4,6-dideoxygalactose transaminase
MEEADSITNRRLSIWNTYHQWFANAEKNNVFNRPIIPASCGHNAHMYYLLLEDLDARTHFIDSLKQEGIHSVFHYVPLHSAPEGRKVGRVQGELKNTLALSERLVRLPLWLGLEERQPEIINKVLVSAAALNNAVL